MLDISTETNEAGGSLQGRLDGTLIGHIDYVAAGPGKIDLNHTRVFPEFEGKGYGRQLVAAAVAFARKNGLTLLASCPYAALVLSRNSEWSDVWGKT